MSEPKSRHVAGRTLFECHRINGESAWIDAIDARRTVQRLPDEWAYTPFSEAQQAAARKDMPLDPANVRRGEAGFVPVHG